MEYQLSWEWTFEGGTPSTSNVKNPEGIVYLDEGTVYSYSERFQFRRK